jgi:hypothetical protein
MVNLIPAVAFLAVDDKKARGVALALRRKPLNGNPPMPKKVYTVIVTLPDLAAAHAEYEIKIESVNWSQAVTQACEEISKRPHVRGRHIRSAKIIFTVAASNSEPENKALASSLTGDRVDQGMLFDL